MRATHMRAPVGTMPALGLALVALSAQLGWAAEKRAARPRSQPAAERRARHHKRRAKSRPAFKPIKLGQLAPDFQLPRLKFETDKQGKTIGRISAEKVALSSFRGKKPVFLIFSSYT